MSALRYSVSVLLPAYQRGPHVELSVWSWIWAWLYAGVNAPTRLEIVVVDDSWSAPGGVDADWLFRCGDAAGEVLRSRRPREIAPQEHLTLRVVGAHWGAGAKTSKASVASLNHAAAVASGDVLVLSNAESAVLRGYAVWPGRDSQLDVERAPAAPGRLDSDPRAGPMSWRHRDALELDPFKDAYEVARDGGYTVGTCVNVGREEAIGPWDAGGAQAYISRKRAWPEVVNFGAAPPVNTRELLRSVPMRGMRNPADHAWRSHPSWRPTDLHWASLIRRENFWQLGGFSPRWHGAATGWGEDGEFSWRVRLWCQGSDAPAFRVSTRTVVAHQWHPSAGGDSAAVVGYGESLYDHARWEAWRAFAATGSPACASSGEADWQRPAFAFPGALVVSQVRHFRFHE